MLISIELTDNEFIDSAFKII